MSYRRFFLVLLSCFMISAAFAADLQPSDIIITNHLSDGYIQVEFPYYDDDGRDDFLKYDYSSYISIEGNTVLKMRASTKSGGSQSKEPYWIELDRQNYNDEVYVVQENEEEERLSYVDTDI